MSKRIRSFKTTERAMFINLEDRDSSVCVDFAEGNILLFEGTGPDCYHGAMVSPEDFRGFALNLTERDEWEVMLRFGDITHVLGVTESVEEATRWLRKAAEIIRSKMPTAKTASEQTQEVHELATA